MASKYSNFYYLLSTSLALFDTICCLLWRWMQRLYENLKEITGDWRGCSYLNVKRRVEKKMNEKTEERKLIDCRYLNTSTFYVFDYGFIHNLLVRNMSRCKNIPFIFRRLQQWFYYIAGICACALYPCTRTKIHILSHAIYQTIWMCVSRKGNTYTNSFFHYGNTGKMRTRWKRRW